MTESERLIELLKESEKKVSEIFSEPLELEEWLGVYADYLLANGVIVQPCKVGDTVYVLAGPNGHKYEKDICEGFYIGDDGVVQVRVRNMKGNHGTYGVIGETVFLTSEEAEKALEGWKNEHK